MDVCSRGVCSGGVQWTLLYSERSCIVDATEYDVSELC